MSDLPVTQLPSMSNLSISDIYMAVDVSEPNSADQSKKVTHIQLIDFLNASGLLKPFRGALIYKSGNQAIVKDAATKVIWQLSSYDTDNIQNTNTAMLIPTGVSKIKLWASIKWAVNSTGKRMVRFIKDGQDFIGNSTNVNDPNGDNELIAMISTPTINVVVGDEFEVEVTQGTSGNLDVLSNSGHATWYALEIIE